MKPFFLICFLLFLIGAVQGQPNLQFYTQFHYGSILKHSSKMEQLQIKPAYAFDAGIMKQTRGKKLWQQALNYPKAGLGFNYTYFGNEAVLGSAIGIYPFLAVKIKSLKKLTIYGKTGLGAAYITKPYDRLQNPENVAIGTKINALASFNAIVEWRLVDNLSFLAGGTFNHFSSGSFKKPNLGLNIGSAFLGLNYYLSPAMPDLIKDTFPQRRKWHYNIRTGIGFKEYLATGGPMYYIYTLSGGFYKFTGAINKLGGGFETEYNTLVYHFIINNFAFMENEAQKATKISFYVEDEILLGQMGVVGQVGIYLYNPFLGQGPFYSRLGLQYHFLPLGKEKDIYAGFYLKSHYFKADYMQFGLGVNF